MLIQNRIESFVSCWAAQLPFWVNSSNRFFLFLKQFIPCVLAEYFSLETALWKQIKHHLYTLIYYYNMQLLGLRVVANIFALEVKIRISI